MFGNDQYGDNLEPVNFELDCETPPGFDAFARGVRCRLEPFGVEVRFEIKGEFVHTAVGFRHDGTLHRAFRVIGFKRLQYQTWPGSQVAVGIMNELQKALGKEAADGPIHVPAPLKTAQDYPTPPTSMFRRRTSIHPVKQFAMEPGVYNDDGTTKPIPYCPVMGQETLVPPTPEEIKGREKVTWTFIHERIAPDAVGVDATIGEVRNVRTGPRGEILAEVHLHMPLRGADNLIVDMGRSQETLTAERLDNEAKCHIVEDSATWTLFGIEPSPDAVHVVEGAD